MNSSNHFNRRQMLQFGATVAAASAVEESHALPSTTTSQLDIATLFQVRDKVAVITDVGLTGSLEVAGVLASAGARVVIADRVPGSAKDIAVRAQAIGHDIGLIEADIEEERSVLRLFAEVERAEGRADILVNCAGLSIRRPLTETTTEIWDRLVSANLRSNFLCMREAVKLMLAGGRGGRIVNVSTIGVLHPVLNGNGAYGASRAGVTQLGRSTALDYAAQGILVNTILAGSISDKVRQEEGAGAKATTGPIGGAGRVPLGRGNMIDIAAAVLFLVSPASRYMTGQEIVLDGGFLLS